MIKPIKFSEVFIENYKNFSSLFFSNLASINLITGKNNSGKTSLLEALFLCLGPSNPELLINILNRRGLLTSVSSANYFFHDLKFSNKIKMIYKTDPTKEYSLKIQLNESKSYSVSKANLLDEKLIKESHLIGSSNPVDIKIILTYPNKKTNVSEAIFLPDKITFSGERSPIFSQSVFISSQIFHDPGVESNRYSDLDRNGRIPEFVDYLKIIEPNIKRTSLISENNTTIIAADIGYGLVPLSLLGEGITKLASIILAISQSRNAVCLIDEVENGFHYSIYPKLWETINYISRDNNCQVFCTTHSLECIQSSYKIFGKIEDSVFHLHRLEKKDMENSIITYAQDELKTAIEADWEVR